jgi:hypothetical protein|nr:MAG TPA: hypothetical protein [Caudoviricetes sp.]
MNPEQLGKLIADFIINIVMAIPLTLIVYALRSLSGNQNFLSTYFVILLYLQVCDIFRFHFRKKER